jgi:hypothetical protein
MDSPIPDWMNKHSQFYDGNWENRLDTLGEAIYVRCGNGDVRNTTSRVHLARWIHDDNAEIIANPNALVEEVSVELLPSEGLFPGEDVFPSVAFGDAETTQGESN